MAEGEHLCMKMRGVRNDAQRHLQHLEVYLRIKKPKKSYSKPFKTSKILSKIK